MNRKLIITADDYNGDPFINSGIHKAIDAGVITTVAAFSNTEEALKNLQYLSATYGHKIRIGAHLSVSSGYVLSGALMAGNAKFNPHTQQYHFPEFGNLIIDAFNPTNLEQEMKAQLDVFEAAGIDIDHISIHQGTILLKQEWLDVLLKLATSFYPNRIIPIRAFLRASQVFSLWVRDVYDADLLNKQIFVNAWQLTLKNGLKAIKLIKSKKYFKDNTIKAALANIRMPNPLIDSYYGAPTPLNLSKILYNLPRKTYDPFKGHFVQTEHPPVFELMVHLADGIPEDTINGISKDYFNQRIQELNVLIKNLPHLITDFKIDLAHFHDIPA